MFFTVVFKCRQRHFSIPLGNEQQAVWGSVSLDLQFQVTDKVTRKWVLQFGDIIINCNNCINNSSHSWLRMCSRQIPFLHFLAGQSKTRNHSWKFLSLLLLTMVPAGTANILLPSKDVFAATCSNRTPCKSLYTHYETKAGLGSGWVACRQVEQPLAPICRHSFTSGKRERSAWWA